MQLHRFGKHPIHLAVVLLLASYAQAQDLSINSMTLDTETGKSLGNISRRGEMKSFFQVQKEMVFNTLSHLGVKLEDLPPKLRQEIERPQTTNSEAFAAFSKAVDKADKGQFAQAAQLFKQAAKIDPGFGLAKGMARLMPAFDLAPGDGKKAVADMKQNAKDEGKKQGDKLSDNLDKKEKNLKEKTEGKEKTKEKLAKLADGKDDEKEEDKEEKQSGIKKKLDQLGLSDEGDDKGFKPGEGEDAGLPRVDPDLLGGGGGGFLDPLTLAQQLGQGDVIIPVIPIPPVTTIEGTDTLNQANDDKQREEVVDQTPQPTSGIYGGIIAGQFVSGSTALTLPSELAPTVLSMDLIKGSDDPEHIEFHLDSEGGGSYTSEMFWGRSGSYSGQVANFGDNGDNDFIAFVYGNGAELSKPDFLIAINGTPTPANKLPTSGVQAFEVDGIITDSKASDGYSLFAYGAQVDWHNNKVFSPAVKSDGNDGVLMIGTVNRGTSSLDVQAWEKHFNGDSDVFSYGATEGMNLALYGSNEPLLGAGLVSIQQRDLANQPVGAADKGIALAGDFGAVPTPANNPAEGETWTGFSAGIRTNHTSSGFSPELGKSRFTFSPASATVTGGIYTSADQALFTTSASDPNAFFGKDAFAAETDNALGLPSYYSTQGDFSGPGWSDLQYTSMGYWTHDYSPDGTFSYLDISTWVAGQATPTSALDSLHLQSGSADYAGKVLGAQQGLDQTESARMNLITGDFNMTVDFGSRAVSGALTNLRRDYDDSVWLDRADFSASFTGNGYSATMVGQGINSDVSLLTGAFYGPNAEETGGAWQISRNSSDWAAGVYAAKRGDILVPKQTVSGFYGGVIGGQFVSGPSSLTPPDAQAPSILAIDLDKQSGEPEHLEFQVDSGGATGSYSSSLFWGQSGGYSGEFNKVGGDSYATQLFSTGVLDKPILISVNGTPTPTSKLPTSEVQAFVVDGIVTDSQAPDGFNHFAFGAQVDWQNNKVFSPAVRSDHSDGILMIGTVNRGTGSLDTQAWEKNFSGSQDVFSYGATEGMNLALYGSNGPDLGAGLFNLQLRDLALQPVGAADYGIAVARNFGAAPSSASAPAEGETWTGFSSGIWYYQNSSSFGTDQGKSRFTFSPATASVTGGFYTSSDLTLFTTSDADPNAFLGKDAFAAKTDNALGLPSYYSTQGDFSGEGWSDLQYTSMGYWTHDHDFDGTYSFLDSSTWVAGQTTPTSVLDSLHLQSGSADYAGKVLGAQHGLDLSENAWVSLITGDFSMSVDFGVRTLSGSLTNLRRDGDASLWLDRADFGASFEGNGYTALISGQGVSDASVLNGAFYGPNAEETGGAWTIYKNANDWAGGVYAAKRGDVYTPLPAQWAGTINGQFEVGSAEMHTDTRNGTQTPPDLVLTLQRTGYGDGQVEYRSYKNSTNYFTYLQSTLWDAPDENTYQSGSTQSYGLDAYFSTFYQSSNTSGVDSINLTAFGGNRTTTAQLPLFGQYAYDMTVLSHDSGGDYSSSGTMAVDFLTHKVFMPARVDPYSDSAAILLGGLDAASATVNAQVWDKNSWSNYTPDPNWAWSHVGGLDMALYGSSVDGQANTGGRVLGGLFNGLDYDYNGVQSAGGQGVASGYSWGGGAYYSRVAPADGDAWSGFTANLHRDNETGAYGTSAGGANFILTPDIGQVTADISDYGFEMVFSSTASDPNAYMATNGFGGLHEGTNNQAPFYYSTRSRDTGWESLPGSARDDYLYELEYHYIGMWTAEYNGSSILPASSWVAGAVTPNADIPSAGYVKYAGFVSGVAVSGDNSQFDFISGLFGMTMDFGQRTFKGSIDNLTTAQSGQYTNSGFDFQGILDSYGGSVFSSSSTQDHTPADRSTYAGVEGVLYGLNGAAAREAGGHWWWGDIYSGEEARGIFTARDSAQLYWSSGVLSDIGAQGVFAIGHPLAAIVNSYSYGDNTRHLDGSFLLPGTVGYFHTGDITNVAPVADRPYLQWTMSQSDDAYADAYYSSYPYTYLDFKNSKSYVQYSPEMDFYRFIMLDAEGMNGVEGYSGTRSAAWSLPDSGISTYDFHQSALENGMGKGSVINGQNGLFPGRLYVNWETGAVFGYNADPAVEGGGKGMFLGRLNRDTVKLEGTYVVGTNRQWTGDPADTARYMEDANGVSLELFGGNSIPSGIGAVFNTALYGEQSIPGTGQALISGLYNKTAAAPVVAPVEGEVWNGFAVGFFTDRLTGNQFVAGSAYEDQVAITFHPDTGHVGASVMVGWYDSMDNVTYPMGADIASDNDPLSEAEHQAGATQTSASMYVSPKAFGVVQKTGDGGATFVAAAPEAFDEQEAARYEYTTWGAWGGDINNNGGNNNVSPNSMWVAGKLTQTTDLPSGTATYTGMVAGQVTGSESGYVKGQLNMNVDFGQRSVGGTMDNLKFANGTTWIPQATISGDITSGGNNTATYSASLGGANSAGKALGAFFGPKAIETGGLWTLQKSVDTNVSQGAGIFVGRRGATSTGE